MKKSIYLTLWFILGCWYLNSQGVLIGDTGVLPHQSAILELKTLNKGFLPPRLTEQMRDSIQNPADVLVIFNLTSRCFEWWDADSSRWVKFGCSEGSTGSGGGGINPPNNNFDFGCLAIGGLQDEVPYHAIRTRDKGIAIVGSTNSWGQGTDAYVVKLDSNANFQWGKVFGGNGIDEAKKIIEVSDSIYYIIGHTSSFSSNYEFFVAKMDNQGNILFFKTTPISTNDDMVCTDAELAPDGGVFIVGTLSVANGEMFVTRINSAFSGVIYSIHHYAYTINDYSSGHKIITNPLNPMEVYVAGRARMGGHTHGFLFWRMGVGGNFLDYFILGSNLNGYHLFLTSMAVLNDGTIFLGGFTPYFGVGGNDYVVMRLNPATLSPVWVKTYGGPGDEMLNYILPTSDGNLALIGSTTSFGSVGTDGYIIKINQNGDTVWARRVGGNSWDKLQMGFETPNKDLIVIGETLSGGNGNKDIFLVRLNEQGQSCCALATATQSTNISTVKSTTTYPASTSITIDSKIINLTSGGGILPLCTP